MKRAWLWMALATTASALWGCGYSCPNGNPVGLYGCVVTCADLPADAGYVCVRPGDERTFDDATGDRSIADGSADTSDTATTTDAADVTAMDQADVGAIEGGEAGTSADAGDASDVSDVTTDGPTVIVDPMLDAPRAVAPSSTSTVTTQRPTLRWSNGATIDGAVVEVSRTRDFATVLHRLSATGDRARVPSALSAGVWFWRLRGRDAARNAEGTATSPIWWFRVGARSADGDRDRSWGSELDLNGDGYADVAVGSPNADGGRGRVDVYYGGARGNRRGAKRNAERSRGGGFLRRVRRERGRCERRWVRRSRGRGGWGGSQRANRSRQRERVSRQRVGCRRRSRARARRSRGGGRFRKRRRERGRCERRWVRRSRGRGGWGGSQRANRSRQRERVSRQRVGCRRRSRARARRSRGGGPLRKRPSRARAM
jgi:hypothetical protein